ncbi:hypothetical protein [Streptomyces murinus]
MPAPCTATTAPERACCRTAQGLLELGGSYNAIVGVGDNHVKTATGWQGYKGIF